MSKIFQRIEKKHSFSSYNNSQKLQASKQRQDGNELPLPYRITLPYVKSAGEKNTIYTQNSKDKILFGTLPAETTENLKQYR